MTGYHQHSRCATLAGRAGQPGRRRAIGPLGTAARLAVGLSFILLGLLLGGDGVEWTSLVLGLAAMPAVAALAQLARLAVAKTAMRATGPLAFCANLIAFGVLLVLPWTSHPTFVFLGASMLVAAWRGYAGCETLAISNWLLRRDDQIGCVLFTPIDQAEAHLRGDVEASPPSRLPTRQPQRRTSKELLSVLIIGKLAGCTALIALLVYGVIR